MSIFWENAAIVFLGALGAVPFGVAVVVGLGLLPVPRHRMWGSAAAMPRGGFALYFGALGLSLWLVMFLILNFRDSPRFLAIVIGPAVIGGLLLAGWISMLRRNPPA